MRSALLIARRELFSLWVTPLAWLLLVSFLLLQGGIFYALVLHYADLPSAAETGPLAAYYGQNSLLLGISLLFFCPALTMRSFAEERKTGSIELLLASPVSSLSLVVGKYLGALLTFASLWLPTLVYPLLLRSTGHLVWPVVFSSYVGLGCLGASYLGVGVFMSALSRSQLSAFLLSMLALFGLYVFSIGEFILPEGSLRDLATQLSMTTLLEETSRGLLDSRRILLHASLALWTLGMTTAVVERWRSE